MNKTFIIGNLTRAPETRTTQDGRTVCNFTVAVNRHAKGEHPEADYFRVTAWRDTAENCAKYLDKGKKVCVIGPVRASAYIANDGAPRASLEIQAETVEFLTPKAGQTADRDDGYVQVDDETPFTD